MIESSRIWRRKNFRDRFLNDEKQEVNLDESNGKRLKKGGKPSPDNDIQLMVYSIRE